MVNAIKLAARFIDRLPVNRLSPETTGGREGFVHPYVVQAAVDRTSVKFHRPRLRHPRARKEKESWLRGLAEEVVGACPAPPWRSEIDEQYRNMHEGLDRDAASGRARARSDKAGPA